MKNLVGQKIGGYTITENVQKAFELLEVMSEEEKETFFKIIELKIQQETHEMEKQIQEMFKTNLV